MLFYVHGNVSCSKEKKIFPSQETTKVPIPIIKPSKVLLCPLITLSCFIFIVVSGLPHTILSVCLSVSLFIYLSPVFIHITRNNITGIPNSRHSIVIHCMNGEITEKKVFPLKGFLLNKIDVDVNKPVYLRPKALRLMAIIATIVFNYLFPRTYNGLGSHPFLFLPPD